MHGCGAAELYALLLQLSQRQLGTLTDLACFPFSEDHTHLQQLAAGFWEISTHKLDLGVVEQLRTECQVAGQAVKRCDDQGGLLFLAQLDGVGQCWALIHAARLDLCVLTDQRPLATVKVAQDALALCIQAKT